MGIDLRAKNRNLYPDRCKWYKGNYVVNNALVKDAVCQGVFYSTDQQDYKEYLETEFGVANTIVKSVIIKTVDFIPGITINDYVMYGGELWRVANIPAKADNNENKVFSSRPITETILGLRR